MNLEVPRQSLASNVGSRSPFSHYLPRLKRELYQANAVVFWTMPMIDRRQGWLDARFHLVFREVLLHAAARECLLCPAYCLMPDHLHVVWMGLRRRTDQRNAVKFLRAQLTPYLHPVRFQHQAHDHVLNSRERSRAALGVACADYVLLNAYKAGLVTAARDWPYLGAVIPGYPRAHPFENGYWEWFWERYTLMLEPGLDDRTLPPREME